MRDATRREIVFGALSTVFSAVIVGGLSLTPFAKPDSKEKMKNDPVARIDARNQVRYDGVRAADGAQEMPEAVEDEKNIEKSMELIRETERNGRRAFITGGLSGSGASAFWRGINIGLPENELDLTDDGGHAVNVGIPAVLANVADLLAYWKKPNWSPVISQSRLKDHYGMSDEDAKAFVKGQELRMYITTVASNALSTATFRTGQTLLRKLNKPAESSTQSVDPQ